LGTSQGVTDFKTKLGDINLNQNNINDKIALCSINVCGLRSKLNYCIFQTFIKTYDFICMSETKCDTLFENDIKSHVPFFMKKHLPSHKYGGIHGLGILIRTCYAEHCHIIDTCISTSTLWLHVNENVLGFSFILAAVYIPHESSVHNHNGLYDELIDDLITVTASYDSPILLLGDFNSRSGTLSDFPESNDELHTDQCISENPDVIYFLANKIITRSNKDKCMNNNGHKLIDLCKMSGLKIVNGRIGRDKLLGNFTCHTANGKSVIDYAIASMQLFPYLSDFYVDVLDRSISDVHCAISLYICKSINEQQSVMSIPENIAYNKTSSTVCKWKNELSTQYTQAFSHENVNDLQRRISNVLSDISNVTQSCIDELYEQVADVFIQPAKCTGMYKKFQVNETKSKKQRRYKREDWFNVDCEHKRKIYLKLKNEFQIGITLAVQDDLDAAFKQYKKLVKKSKKEFTKSFHSKIRSLKTRSPKDFWDILNKDCKVKKIPESVLFSDLLNHFQQLNSINITHSSPGILNVTPGDDNYNDEVNMPFTVMEIKHVIKNLKRNKACGIDNILNEFLKNCPLSCLHMLCDFFNIVLNTGIVPLNWCAGIILPIYKNKGSPSDPDNYRGITLLSCIGKLFTACVNKRLSNYVENEILGNEQAGFRAGYSTCDHMFVLHSVIELYLSVRKRVYCAFIDYKKAFDTIDRYLLWQKLLNQGINGKIFQVITCMYTNAKSCIRKYNLTSTFFPCNIGVRQGENLSPLLFALFINDFSEFISNRFSGLTPLQSCYPSSNVDEMYFIKLFTLLYADDTIVLAETENELQLALDAVYEYCSMWKLTLNTDKTKIIIFSRGKVRKFPIFNFGESNICVTSDYVYLGVTFNYNNKFTKAIKKQLDQGQRAMFSMLVKARRLSLPIDIQCELFDQVVLPVLLYGSEIWGYSSIEMLEVLFRKFIKKILKLHRSTPNAMIYGEIGKLCLQARVDKHMISYWLRLIIKEHTTLSYTFYSIALKLYDTGTYELNWLKRVKYILVNCGLSYIWDRQDDIDTSRAKIIIHSRIDDLETQKWFTSISISPMCSMYNQFKQLFHFEKYLLLPDCKSRILLSKFRCRNMKLPIQTCTYLETSNICTLCENNLVGDEYHYLLICPALNLERSLYISKYYYAFPSFEKMNQLMTTHSKKKLKKLSKFLNVVSKKFK